MKGLQAIIWVLTFTLSKLGCNPRVLGREVTPSDFTFEGVIWLFNNMGTVVTVQYRALPETQNNPGYRFEPGQQ